LHCSAAVHGSQPEQVELQACVPDVPHEVVQPRVAVVRQVKSSSAAPSRSSSQLLQVSAPTHASHPLHAALQDAVPAVPQEVGQGIVVVRRHMKPSSATPSASSSQLLQASSATHGPNPQRSEHVASPPVPHAVVQAAVVAGKHSNSSSVSSSQSSSRPLHSSAAVQSAPAGIPHVAVQVPRPTVSQDVRHGVGSPEMQANVSSVWPSQLSSPPLHVSSGTLHAEGRGASQAAEHRPVPLDLQRVSHGVTAPATQSKSSSDSSSQSSSCPLHASSGGVQADPSGGVQSAVQIPVPVGPRPAVTSHDVEHAVEAPARHVASSSVAPSQSSSFALHPSESAGKTHAVQSQVGAHAWVPSPPSAQGSRHVPSSGSSGGMRYVHSYESG
jgi:hypothetical protein